MNGDDLQRLFRRCKSADRWIGLALIVAGGLWGIHLLLGR